MKTLHLLRHAKSSRTDPSWVDFERPLARRGERDAAALAQDIPAMALRPQLILCSPALRARGTLAAIASALPAPATTRFEQELYMATASGLVRRLHAVSESVNELLLIGHNPGLEDLALLLTRHAPEALRIKLSEKFPTCALLTLELELSAWRELAPDCATLRRFWPITRAQALVLPGQERTAVHAPKLAFEQDGSWTDLAQAALTQTRTHAYANVAGAAAGEAESIHQLRVALRKLRLVLRSFDDAFDAAVAQALSTRARSLFRSLGAVRELDVMDETYLSPLVHAHPREPGLLALRSRLRSIRQERLVGVQRMLRGTRLDKLTHSLDVLGAGVASERKKPRKRARKQLGKRLSRVTELATHAPEADSARLHALRKELKQLRYRAEIFAPLFKRRRVRAYASVMSRLQDALGALNDVAVARGTLGTSAFAGTNAASKRARKLVDAALTAREQAARAKLSHQLHKLVHAAPFWC